MNSLKNSSLKTTVRLFTKRHKKAVIASFGLLILFIVGQVIYWLATTPNDIQIVDMPKVAELSDNYQVNIFVAPNWLIGVDGSVGQVKYLQLDEDIDVNQLTVVSKKRHILIDAYIIPDKGFENIEDLPGMLINGTLSGKLASNLTRMDLLKLWSSVRGNIVYQVQHDQMLIEDSVQNEHLSIGVFNATEIPGLAREASLWLENIGGKVVELGNYSSNESKSIIEIYVEKKQAKAISRRLEDIFKVKPKYTVGDNVKFDVKVVVGSDFIE